MKRRYEVQNVKCGGCAATLKKNLEPLFGEVVVDLEVEPRAIELEIADDKQEELLRQTLRKLGYPLADEELGTLAHAGAKAKSFVSCAIGKIENAKGES